MRVIVLLIIAIFMHALEIKVQTAKEASSNAYAILTLSSSDAFNCFQLEENSRPANKFQCNFKAPPSEQIEPIEDAWYKIIPQAINGNFSVRIEPKKQSKLIPQSFDATNNKAIQIKNISFAKTFLIVAYDKTLPYIKPQTKAGLNFPVTLKTPAFPYVKTLDVNGYPIGNVNSFGDMREYMNIKRLIEKESYNDALKDIDKAEKYHPNSIFFSDFEYLRLKALMGTGSTDGWISAIASSKDWLRNYSGDDKMPEVLYILATAYAKMSDHKNCDYYLRMIIDNYPQMEISKKAMIALGDSYAKELKYKNATEWYRKALYATQDVQIASEAAYKAAEMYLVLKEPIGAREYIAKVLNGNMEYALKNKQKAFELANKIAGVGDYKEAIQLGEALFKEITPEDPNYSKLLYLLGLWSEQGNNKQQAKEYYARFIKEFPSEKYTNEAQTKLDALVFQDSNPDDEKSLVIYNELIKKYGNDQIGQSALAKKAQLLSKLDRCSEYLQELPTISKLPKTMLSNEASLTLDCKQKVAYERLDKKECKTALELIDNSKLTMPDQYQQKLFNCYLEQSRFKDAINQSYAQAKKGNGQNRLVWLSNYEKALLTKEDYKVAIQVADDAIKLSKALNIKGYDFLWLDRFKSAYKINNLKEMIDSIGVIEQIYGSSTEAIEPYRNMINYGVSKNDDLIIQKYARKLIGLQIKLKTKTETPWVEFTLADSLSKKNDTVGAINVIKLLKGVKLTNEQNARRLYTLAINELKINQKQQAQKDMQECAGIKDGGAWSKLCVSGIDMLKQQ